LVPMPSCTSGFPASRRRTQPHGNGRECRGSLFRAPGAEPPLGPSRGVRLSADAVGVREESARQRSRRSISCDGCRLRPHPEQGPRSSTPRRTRPQGSRVGEKLHRGASGWSAVQGTFSLRFEDLAEPEFFRSEPMDGAAGCPQGLGELRKKPQLRRHTALARYCAARNAAKSGKAVGS